MQRSDVYLKVQLVHGNEEDPKKIASELCRQLAKAYTVRSVEVSNVITPSE